MTSPRTLTRRRFLGTAAVAVAGAPLFDLGLATASEGLPSGNWGSIVGLTDGVWAVASTPLAHRDFKTVCNGGIVAGKDRVLVIEAFAGRPGAQWVADAAHQLTGRWPTDVVITHYHGDHSGGLTGFVHDGHSPALHSTNATLERIQGPGGDETQEERDRAALISAANRIEEGSTFDLDLGGRSARLHPRGGHTASDVTVELPEIDLGFGGDLVWSGMIPNFVDARPARLAKTLRAMRDGGMKRYVPGHGALGEAEAVNLNIDLLTILEEAASRSLEAGRSASEAAAGLTLPSPFDKWVAFSPSYVERAIGAWQVDLKDRS